MHPRWLAMAGVLVVTSAAGCAYGIKATSDHNPQVDFSTYGTFFILKGNSSGDSLIDARLDSDVANALLAKGWVEVPQGEGRAAVIVNTATNAEHSYDTFYDGWGGWHWKWNGYSTPSRFIDDYKPGTVVVTIFDADSKQPIWRGFAADAISDKPGRIEKVHDAAVARMFEAAQSEDSTPTDLATEAHDVSGPKIIFSTVPAVLVMVEGDPILRDVTGTTLKRVVNTKALILRDEADAYYIKILDGWMQAYALGSWWDACDAPPQNAGIALRQARADASVNLLDASARQALGGKRSLNEGEPPAIYVSTTPAILVVTNGLPQFAAVPGTTLEYVTNTTSHIFREPTDRELYVLTGNGWYRSWRTEGPWHSIASAELPNDIARLPSSQLAMAGGVE